MHIEDMYLQIIVYYLTHTKMSHKNKKQIINFTIFG